MPGDETDYFTIRSRIVQSGFNGCASLLSEIVGLDFVCDYSGDLVGQWDGCMASAGDFAQTLGNSMGVSDAPAVVTRTLRKAEIAVTELRAENPPYRMSEPTVHDGYVVALQLRDYPDHEYWEDGKCVARPAFRAGETCIYDMKRGPHYLVNNPFHSVHFILPHKALDAIAEDASAPKFTELAYKPGVGIDDVTVRNLGMSMLAVLENPKHASRLFADHVALAVGVHVAQAYGGMMTSVRPVQGGLAPWQERRAKEILSANLDGSVTLKEIARECGLSVSHFSRAFRRSIGLAPHSWLLQHRVSTAKKLLSDKTLSLSNVALTCGFADQSHFTRVFTREIGTSPGAFRRCNEE